MPMLMLFSLAKGVRGDGLVRRGEAAVHGRELARAGFFLARAAFERERREGAVVERPPEAADPVIDSSRSTHCATV